MSQDRGKLSHGISLGKWFFVSSSPPTSYRVVVCWVPCFKESALVRGNTPLRWKSPATTSNTQKHVCCCNCLKRDCLFVNYHLSICFIDCGLFLPHFDKNRVSEASSSWETATGNFLAYEANTNRDSASLFVSLSPWHQNQKSPWRIRLFLREAAAKL